MRVGNAPVSWAVYEADRPNPPFARRARRDRGRGLRGHRARALRLPADGPRRAGRGAALARPRPWARRSCPCRSRTRRGARGRSSARSPWRACSRPRASRELILADDEDPRAARGSPAASPPTAARAGATRSGARPWPRSTPSRARCATSWACAWSCTTTRAPSWRRRPRSSACWRRPTRTSSACCSTPATPSTAAATRSSWCARHGERIRYVHLKDVARGRAGARARARRSPWTRPGRAASSARWATASWTFPRVVEALRGRGLLGLADRRAGRRARRAGPAAPGARRERAHEPRVPAGPRRVVARLRGLRVAGELRNA